MFRQWHVKLTCNATADTKRHKSTSPKGDPNHLSSQVTDLELPESSWELLEDLMHLGENSLAVSAVWTSWNLQCPVILLWHPSTYCRIFESSNGWINNPRAKTWGYDQISYDKKMGCPAFCCLNILEIPSFLLDKIKKNPPVIEHIHEISVIF